MINNMKRQLATIWDFVLRNSIWIVLCIAGLWFLGFDDAMLKTISLAIVAETVALSLSNIALFVYTKARFNNKILVPRYIVQDKNNANAEMPIYDSIEQQVIARVIGSVFIGVHILVGMVVLGIYIVM